MGLKDYVPPTKTIALPGDNSMEVRGVSFADIAALASKHLHVMTFLYQKFVAEKDAGFTAEGMGGLIVAAMNQFPEAVAELIARAADEPDLWQKVMVLPPATQAEAIEQIIGLTFIGEGDVKKLVEIVTRLLTASRETLDGLTMPIPSGSGSGAFASN